MKVLRLFLVFAIGYVLGARAGRRRYEQIRDVAVRVSDDPRVQQAAGKAEGLVREAVDTVKGSTQESGSTWPEHPDAHVEVPDDEVVYSAGPDGR